MEWAIAATAPDQITAEMWCQILQGEGVPAFAKLPGGGLHVSIVFGPAAPSGCWVMVPGTQLDKAAAILESVLDDEPPGHRR